MIFKNTVSTVIIYANICNDKILTAGDWVKSGHFYKFIIKSNKRSFILQNFLAIMIFLFVQMKQRIGLSMTLKNCVGILMRIALLYVVFGKMALFTMLVIPNYEHGRSFCILISSYENTQSCWVSATLATLFSKVPL